MEQRAPDPAKLLEAWMEWERGEATPGRVMSSLKTGGLRILLEAIVEHILPGRTTDARSPNSTELASTRVVSLALDEVSAKVRTGPPVDDEADFSLPTWAGVLRMIIC